MNIDYISTLAALKTIPEQDDKIDICKVVRWEIIFFETTYPDQVWSVAGLETILDTDSLSDSFVDFSDLTQKQILQMAFDQQGGDAFIDEFLRPHHEAELKIKMSLKDVEEKDITEIAAQ